MAKFTGSAVADNLDGSVDNDIINGLAGDDTLRGLGGADFINGGAGKDKMEGGIGNDVYVVDDAGDIVVEATGEGIDEVQSAIALTTGFDNVEDYVFTAAGPVNFTGNDLNNTILGNKGNDSIDGGNGIDGILGGAGADSLSGGNGNFQDILAGGIGADTMAGSDGSDIYLVDNVGDLALEGFDDALGGTLDTVISSVNHTLGFGIEALILDGSANLTGAGNGGMNLIGGNAGANKLFGNAGDDTLSGENGNDTLDGGAGSDSMEGGAGNDTYMFDEFDVLMEEGAGGGIDTAIISASINLSLTGVQVERIVMAAGAGDLMATAEAINTTITGNEGDNFLGGDFGADTLLGGAGNDTLSADPAVDDNKTDSLAGGAGNDEYRIATGDIVSETLVDAPGGTDTVTVQLGKSNSYVLGANVENLVLGNDVLLGSGNALDNKIVSDGSADANTISGLTGNDTLEGGDGNDTLNGGLGADSLVGGAGDDLLLLDSLDDKVSELAAEGRDRIETALQLSNAGAYANVDDFKFTGTKAVNFTGNGLDNQITGTAANDELNGAGGNDTLIGGKGADTLEGSAGNDSYVVDNAKDVVSEAFGSGIDDVVSSISFSLEASGTVIDQVENLFLTGAANLTGTGNFLDNIIGGNDGANKLSGGDGIDTIDAIGGNDTIDGGTGADFMLGGIGNDTYVVDDLNDFVFEGGASGTDTVLSSVNFDLSLAGQVENLTLKDAAVVGNGNALNNLITGNGLSNVLTGGSDGKDTLIGGGGDDEYQISNGDVVIETLGGLAGGTDKVAYSGTGTYVLTNNVENLFLTSAPGEVNGTGNALGNIINGNNFANVLDGKGGADTMTGGKVSDIYIFDNAGDKTIELADGGLDDQIKSSIALAAAIANVEHYTFLTAAPVTFIGDTAGNRIIGGSGKDKFDGGGGDDTLAGGNGNDTMTGGIGADLLSGEAGADSLDGGADGDTYAVFNSAAKAVDSGVAGTDIVISLAGYAIDASIENLILSGAANINGNGNANANQVIGNSGANKLQGLDGNDILTGGAGNDVLIGGIGDDTMRGQAGNDKVSTLDGNDVVVYESIGDGRDAIFSFDGDATGGQDVLNLDALFDILGVADVDRAARVQIIDKGSTVEVRVNTGANPDFDLFVATIQTTDAITVGQDVLVGS